MPTEAWTPWYAHATVSRPYLIDGGDETYRLGAQWLEGLNVSDWGCGLGWMRRYVPPDRYTGIDGTESKLADVVTDLRTWRTPCEGLFMRHVLEHDEQWPSILGNAVEAFERRMFLVLYTPLVVTTYVRVIEPTLGVPEICFNLTDLLEVIGDCVQTIEAVGQETVFRMEK